MPDHSARPARTWAAVSIAVIFVALIWISQTTPAAASTSSMATGSLPHITFKSTTLNTPPPPRPTPFLAGSPSVISGEYVIGVAKNSSLTTAASTISALGGTVVYTLQYSHDVVAKLTASQEQAVNKISGVQYVKPNYAQSSMGIGMGIGSVALASSGSSSSVTVVRAGSPTVAIVDDFSTPTSHGYEVLASYQSQCAATNCGVTNPTLISGFAPDGSFSNASNDNAITYAITVLGAKYINVSSGDGCAAGGACNLAGSESSDDLNTWELAQNNNVLIAYAAGNNADYTQEGYFATNPYISNLVYVGVVDPNTGLIAPDSSLGAEVFVPNSSQFTSFAAPVYLADAVAVAKANPTYNLQETIAAADNLSGNLTNADFTTSYNNGEITLTYTNTSSSNGVTSVYSYANQSNDYYVSTSITSTNSNGDPISVQKIVYGVETDDDNGNNSYAPTNGSYVLSNTTELLSNGQDSQSVADTESNDNSNAQDANSDTSNPVDNAYANSEEYGNTQDEQTSTGDQSSQDEGGGDYEDDTGNFGGYSTAETDDSGCDTSYDCSDGDDFGVSDGGIQEPIAIGYSYTAPVQLPPPSEIASYEQELQQEAQQYIAAQKQPDLSVDGTVTLSDNGSNSYVSYSGTKIQTLTIGTPVTLLDNVFSQGTAISTSFPNTFEIANATETKILNYVPGTNLNGAPAISVQYYPSEPLLARYRAALRSAPRMDLHQAHMKCGFAPIPTPTVRLGQ